jgi:hypothetical protein
MTALDKEVAALSRADRLAGLKRIIPRQRIKRVLRLCRKQRSCPRLPAFFMVWFVLAMGLFCRDCYRQVFRWIRPWSKLGVPGRSTLCEARGRLGVRPLVLLAKETVRFLAEPQTPGAFYRASATTAAEGKASAAQAEPPLRLVAIDGFVLDLPDTPENERVFGRPPGSRAPGAFPQARIVALCEAGTHVMAHWLCKPIRVAEQFMADYLLRFLTPGMLLMWDRNFLSYARVGRVIRTGAQLLARVQKGLIFQPIQRLSDDSYLARLYADATARKHDREGILLRVIDYTFDDPRRPGAGEKHRLLTTLLDEAAHPSATLIELYHQRWEQELAIDEIKTHEMERPTLRSQTPAGVVQEVYALLLGHFVIRRLMFEAASRVGAEGEACGVDPRRLSFTGTLKILRCRIPGCPEHPAGQRRWWEDLMAEIGQEQLEPRRNRINPRVIKRKMSKWKKKRPIHRNYPQPSKPFGRSIVMIR